MTAARYPAETRLRRAISQDREARLARRWLLGLAVVFALGLGLSAALSRDFHSNPSLLEWIPATCCVTNDCCWEISERELTPLPADAWMVNSTGQERKRTDWSPDGRFYRCACDYDLATQKWIRHQGANTRCIFVPLRGM